MRILHVITAFNQAGGAERCLLLLAKGLKAQGHQVHIITAGGDNLDALDAAQIPYTILPLNPEQRSFKNTWVSFWGIRKIIKQGNFQIVHCHHRWPALLVWVLSWLGKFTTLTTVHVWHSSRGFKAKLSFKLNLIVAVSKLMQQQLIQDFGVPAKKTRLIYYGLDIDPSYQKVDVAKLYQHRHIPPKSFKFLNIGRLARQKGQKYLITAFRQYLGKQNTNDVLLIVGSGPLQAELAQAAGDLLNQQIFFLGSRPNDQTLALLADADVFVLSSLWEGLPLTLIEAGLLSKPLVATGVDGIKEVVTKPELGLIVPPRDPAALAQAFATIKNNSKLRSTSGQKLHTKVAAQFSENKMLSSYEQVYRELLHK